MVWLFFLPPHSVFLFTWYYCSNSFKVFKIDQIMNLKAMFWIKTILSFFVAAFRRTNSEAKFGCDRKQRESHNQAHNGERWKSATSSKKHFFERG